MLAHTSERLMCKEQKTSQPKQRGAKLKASQVKERRRVKENQRHENRITSYLKRVFGCTAVPLLRVDIWQLVHAGWQVNLYVTPADGLYLVHGHVGGQ